MKNFRTYQLAVEFYRQIAKLRIRGPLRDQLRRASSSIVLNLAEGSGRSGKRDQRRFYSIAFGSLRECQAIMDLELSGNSEVADLADVLAAHLYCLIKNYG
jgi:four helix bundle protein